MSKPFVFLGCGFAAKYRLGGGNFSVPLQWALALKRLGHDFCWLEVMPASDDPVYDRACRRSFRERLAQHGLERHHCLLFHSPAAETQDLGAMRCHGLSRSELEARLAGPNVLLNLSYSIHQPLLDRFERRLLCDLDPTEISYWMGQMEMGQSHHHEFWSIGLNRGKPGCRLPDNGLDWNTFFPLVDTQHFRVAPKPRRPRFTTIGQWYWANNIDLGDGKWVDLSKGAKFQRYLDLPRLLPHVEMELAVNLEAESAERTRLAAQGWRVAAPHAVASSPAVYRRYIQRATGEFTTIKGVDCLWQSGWVSDRAAAFLSSGRPVITEDAGVGQNLPEESGFFEVSTLEEAREAVERSVRDWEAISRRARACAVECFEGTKTLPKMLGF